MTNPTQSALDALSKAALEAELDELANGTQQTFDRWERAKERFEIALVNAYRTGHLTVADPAAIAAAEARGFERGIREAVNEANALSAYHQTGSRSGPFGDVSASALEALIARLLDKLEGGQ